MWKGNNKFQENCVILGTQNLIFESQRKSFIILTDKGEKSHGSPNGYRKSYLWKFSTHSW